MRKLHTRGQYAPDGPAKRLQVRQEAGHRCIRCHHPFETGKHGKGEWTPCDERCTHGATDLGSVAVLPIELDVTLPAQADKVAEGVCLAIAFQTEEAKRHNVRDGEFLGECVLMLAASTTGEAITQSSLRPLKAPIRAVVLDSATLPVRTSRTPEMVSEPLKPARISAESLRRFAWADLPRFATSLTTISDAPRLALLRAMTSDGHPRGWSAEQPSAFRAWLCNGHPKSYTMIVAKWRILTCHHFDGDKSNDAWWNTLALCQRCHLTIQCRVDPNIPFFFEHSEWAKPYIAGYYAWKYENRMITREEAETRLDELLAYELRTVN